VFDGRGGARPLEDNDEIDSEHPCWLHLNYTHMDSAEWLASTPLLPNSVRDALAGDSLRPRVSRMGRVRFSRFAALTAVRMSARINWSRCVSIWTKD
jgi:Mg2+ and Co2+ transporter CorA